MEIIILGLLMLKKCSIYEMKKSITTTFTTMSSNSTGSIQAAIKKLLDMGLVTYNEYVEKSVNKKIYELTENGKVYFYSNISKPMICKEKNMELAKFFFMGFNPKEKWNDLINLYISKLKVEKDKLEQIHAKISDNLIAENLNVLQESGLLQSFNNRLNSVSAEESLQFISTFQIAALEFSIAKFNFEIRWFENFSSNIMGGLKK